MIEEKRNYLKEFYDKKDTINYEEILTKANNKNESDIRALKLEISRLQNKLNEKTNELHIELDKAYNGSYTPVSSRLIGKYYARNGGDYYFDILSGARVSDINEEEDIIYTLDTKVGTKAIVVGYSYENACIIIKKYNYSINNDNTLLKTKPLYTYILSFMNDKQYKYNIANEQVCDDNDYSIRYALRPIKDNEFINTFYGIDYQGELTLEYLRECNLSNKSFEIIIKQAPIEIQDKILINYRYEKLEEPTPIHKILGIQLDTYKSAIERGIILPLYENLQYIGGDKKTILNKTEHEWLDLLEELKAYEEDLKFYGIDYKRHSYSDESSLLSCILEYYCGNAYIQEYYTLGKYINYVVNESINQGYTSIRSFMQDLRDYISMCKGLNIKPTLYSTYLKQTHDITSRNYKIKVETEKEEIFKSRYDNFKEYKNNGYIVITPKETKDLQDEGSRLNHCVASYIKRVIDGECLIYFLRKEDKRDESLITLEVRNNAIVQVKGSHNRKPSDEERKVLEQFAKDRKLGVRF